MSINSLVMFVCDSLLTWLSFLMAFRSLPHNLPFSTSFLPFGWVTTIRSKLSHVIICRKDCSFSLWCHAWKKFLGLLWWARRRWSTCWTVKVRFLLSIYLFYLYTIGDHQQQHSLCFQVSTGLWHNFTPFNLYHFSPFLAGRYHSLVIEKESFPDELEATAWTEDGLIMAARHKKYKHLQVKS